MAHIDGMQMVRTSGFEEAIVLAAAARRATEIRREEREELAALIRNEIAEAWNKGQK